MNLEKIVAVTPIYQANPSELEVLSITHSLRNLALIEHYYIAPTGLDISRYRNISEHSRFLYFPPIYFESHRNYNQLCYEVEFYRTFAERFEYLLILQTDAIVVGTSKDLYYWTTQPYDFIGAPESVQHRYNLEGLQSYHKLKGVFHPVVIQGLNGGLSLRRLAGVISALECNTELANFFRSYAGGVGEDIFFCVMSRASKVKFLTPNEIIASDFALTANISSWLGFRDNALPFGFHAWYRNQSDKDCVFEILGR